MNRILKWLNEFRHLLGKTFARWYERDPFNNSIVIAYYTIFSLPGLLVIVINMSGYFFDKAEVTERLTHQIQATIGGDTAKDVESIIVNASILQDTLLSSILAVAILLVGATGAFYQLQQMLNKIWGVKPKVKTKHVLLALLRDRLFSFGLILVVGFLLLVSLALSTTLSALSEWFTIHLSFATTLLFRVLDFGFSLAAITVLFAAIFKFLPDVKVRWRDVWSGAFLTAVLFVIAKVALGYYFSNSDPASTYGAAGSVILIMLWVSYSGLILLFGAEFTHVQIQAKGIAIKPKESAMVTEK